jgi:threonine dehydratase
VWLAEPAGAAETAESLRRGERVTEFTPDTACDGLRGTLGAPNFDLLQHHHADALVVDDADTVRAMRLVWRHLKQLVEPSSAIALAAVLAEPGRFARQRIGIVLTGGNVDLETLPALLALGD